MTTIKCKKCGTDLEIPYDSNKCKSCGKDLIASVNHSIKTTEAETKKLISSKENVMEMALELQDASVKKVAEINDNAQKEIVKLAEDCIREIETCSSTATKEELEALAEKSKKAQQIIFDKAVSQTNMVAENHKKQIEWLSEETGFEITEELLSEIQTTTRKIPPEPKMEKLVNVTTDAVDYILFFLITPLGMVTVEDHFLGGIILIIGGFMSLPPLKNKILKRFDWISLASFWLLTLVVIIAGMFKLMLSTSAVA